MRIRPVDFYEMTQEETRFMIKGWLDQQQSEQMIARRVAIIVADTMNRTMGGKGVANNIMKQWSIGAEEDDAHDRLMAKMKDRRKSLPKRKRKDGTSKS